VQTVNVFATSKVYRLEVRPASASISNTWLTVFDASGAATNVYLVSPFTAASGNVLDGSVEGAYLTALGPSNPNTVVVFNTTGSDLSGPVSLLASATNTIYLMNGLVPGSTYNISVATTSGHHTIQINSGPGIPASASGTLYFRVDGNGTVTPRSL